MEIGNPGLHGVPAVRIARKQDQGSVTIQLQQMEEKTAQDQVKTLHHVLGEVVQEMETGDPGLHGLPVVRIVRKHDQGSVTIQLQQMEEKTAEDWIKALIHVLEEVVQEMETGDLGLHGHPAVKIARKQDQGSVTVQHQQMEVQIVQVQVRVN